MVFSLFCILVGRQWGAIAPPWLRYCYVLKLPQTIIFVQALRLCLTAELLTIHHAVFHHTRDSICVVLLIYRINKHLFLKFFSRQPTRILAAHEGIKPKTAGRIAIENTCHTYIFLCSFDISTLFKKIRPNQFKRGLRNKKIFDQIAMGNTDVSYSSEPSQKVKSRTPTEKKSESTRLSEFSICVFKSFRKT